MYRSNCGPLLVLMVSVLAFSGCGGSGGGMPSEEERRSAEADYDRGIELSEEGDFAAAEEAFAIAMSGTLPSDVFADAGRNRAIALGSLGRVDEAFSLLDEIQEGLDGEAEYHLLRGLVYRAANETSKAKAEFSKARKLDRTIKIPPA